MPRTRIVLSFSIVLTVLLAGCTGSEGPLASDTDKDGLTDHDERLGQTISILTKNGTVSRHVVSDPERADTDGDGLDDFNEAARRWDPSDPDTDGDGLLDWHNVTLDPDSALAKAWRARGILESEPGHFLGEQGFCRELGGVKSDQWSSDRPLPDDLSDGEELVGWIVTLRGVERRVFSDPCTPDADGDSLLDHDEKRLGTDPNDPDTDGDGARDGQDADPLHDLGLRFTNVSAAAGSRVITITLLVGAENYPFGNGTTERLIDISDLSPKQGELEVGMLVQARDADGAPVRVFPTGADAVFTFDIFAGTVTRGDVVLPEGEITTAGADGTFRFTWAVDRA